MWAGSHLLLANLATRTARRNSFALAVSSLWVLARYSYGRRALGITELREVTSRREGRCAPA